MNQFEMVFEKKSKPNSVFVGERLCCATISIEGDITKTWQKILFDSYVHCNWWKSITVSDKTLRADGLGNFSKILDKAGEKVAIKVIKNPVRTSKMRAKVGRAVLISNLKAALTKIPDVIKVYHTGNGSFLIKFV